MKSGIQAGLEENGTVLNVADFERVGTLSFRA